MTGVGWHCSIRQGGIVLFLGRKTVQSLSTMIFQAVIGDILMGIRQVLSVADDRAFIRFLLAMTRWDMIYIVREGARFNWR